jgi:hypothetical protein
MLYPDFIEVHFLRIGGIMGWWFEFKGQIYADYITFDEKEDGAQEAFDVLKDQMHQSLFYLKQNL